MQATIKLTAFLTNPEGVWERDCPVEFPPGAEKQILVQLTTGVLKTGLVRELGDDEIEIIPAMRVKSITAKLNTVQIASPLDLNAVAPRASTKIQLT